MSHPGGRPPAIPRLILRLLLPADVADAVIGDLNEAYAADRLTHSAVAARWRYWRDAISWDTLRLVREVRRGAMPQTDVKSPRRSRILPGLFREGRMALRSFRRQPSFSITVVLLLAVGVGATTTIFSVVDGVLLRPLPYDESERLAYLDKAGHGASPVPDYRDWMASSTSFSSIAASTDERLTLTGDGAPLTLQGASVTDNFFSTIRVTAYRGRVFIPEDFDGSRSVALIGYGLWHRRWGSDPALIGRTLTLNDRAVTVVGILPPDFVPVDAMWQTGAEVWLPFDLDDPRWGRNTWLLAVLGRLAPGATLESARAEMATVAERLADAYPETNRYDDGRAAEITVTGLQEATVGDVSTALLMVFGAVGLLLLLTAANVANLFLARVGDRRREMAVRSALGAGRGRLVRQLLTEGVVLATIGGALGGGLAVAGVGVFRSLDPGFVPRLNSVSVDWRVLLFALALSLVTGIVFAILPAVTGTRIDLTEALKEGGRSGTGRRRVGIADAIVTGEMAIALMLLVGAGLLLNSFVRLRSVDPGFDPRGVSVTEIRLSRSYDALASKVAFTRGVLERLASLPGVRAVGAAHRVPLGGGVGWGSHLRDVTSAPDDPGVPSAIRTVTPGFLEALGVPLVRGRPFTWADDEASGRVAIVSTALAEALWPGQDPLGKEVIDTDGEEEMGRLTIVGVVGDVQYVGLGEVRSDLYVPFQQYAWYHGVSLAIASTGEGDAGALQAAVQDAVWGADPNLPVPPLQTMTDRMAATVVTPRFYSMLLAAFGGLGLVLAAGGIYGMMLYAVARRRREFGIRLAVGATPRHLLGRVLKRGLALTASGIVLGLGAAIALSRVLESLVFGITTTDLPTYAGVATVLAAVALLACYLPGRRAAATDPVETLNAN